MGSKDTAYNFLQGGGDMGKLIREKDWSKTPLGDSKSWPQPLKTMVDVMLDNPFGMYIAWGKDYTQIYNDGYRPILGTTKHPQALGNSSRHTFSEIWHIIGSMFDGVMEGQSVGFSDFMLPLNRNGYIENCYFDFAYSPIRLESGEVGGVLVTVIETTAKKNADDDLIESKNELEFVIEAAQLGTFDYYPLINKFSTNKRLKEWFGLPNDDQIEFTHALNIVAEADKERVSKAINKVLDYSSGGIYDVEYSIINPSSHKEIIVHAKGRAWFNEDRIAYRMNGTVEDVTHQVLAREKIEESERSLRLMILQAPIAIAIFRGADYQVEIANKFALELWGRTEEQVLHKPLFESMPELLSQGIKDYLDDVAITGNRFATPEMPVKLVRDDVLETVYINFSFEALYNIEGKINGIMAIGYDITPQVKSRKKVEESEQSIRALVESAPFPIAVYQGEDMLISLANQSIMDIWGKGNHVVGNSFSDILPELENQKIFEQIREVLHTGIPFHAKNQRVDLLKNGEIRPYYFNYSFTPLLDASDNVYAVMNTAAEVTQLHEAKYKVEESEKRFRNVVKQAPLGIVIFRGPDNVIEMANDSYLQIIDKTEKQFVGKPLFETLPEVKDTIAPIISDIYNTGKAFYGYEFPINLTRHGKTEINYFNFVYHPLKENDVINGIMVVATEVTATVKAKLLIEENEEKLKLIIEASELGVFDVNLKSAEIVASDRCYEILGFPEERNLTHEEIAKNLHPDDLKIRTEAYEEGFVNGTLRYQMRVIHKDQSIHWIDAKGKVFYDLDNKPERMLGTIRDITEERDFQQQLLEREEKFRLLADSMPQYIWTADPEGNLNYFNQSLYDYTGFKRDELNNDNWIKMVHPDDRVENLKHWLHSVTTGEDYLFEQRFLKHNGDYRWQLSRAIPQKDADGVIKRWVGTSTDIQEQKMFTNELERMVKLRTNELNQKNVDLEKMNKELQAFVYISSHDLQEPLRKIQTFSSRILETEYDALSDTAKKHFMRMQNSASRMQNLIQDLIAYSRTNVQNIKFEIVDLLEIIEDTKEALSDELEHGDITFELGNMCEVRIIPVQFRQVMVNLVTNSIKFSKENQSVKIQIDCKIVKGISTGIKSLSGEKQYCHIRFADNGIGFEQQYHEKIFEVFQRLHSKEEYSGTGIGLAIVKRIIENHEGIIMAHSGLNQGAIFDIYIPTN